MTRFVWDPKLIPSGLCECGCRRATRIATRTVTRRREFKGYPVARLPGHVIHLSKPPINNKRGAEHSAYKSGRTTNLGYVLILTPNHPYGLKHRGYVPEHRLVMEAHLGRYLGIGERVHHLNHNRSDNRLENLVLCSSQSEHMKNHEFGKHPLPVTVETRKKLSEALKRAWQDPNKRPDRFNHS